MAKQSFDDSGDLEPTLEFRIKADWSDVDEEFRQRKTNQGTFASEGPLGGARQVGGGGFGLEDDGRRLVSEARRNLADALNDQARTMRSSFGTLQDPSIISDPTHLEAWKGFASFKRNLLEQQSQFHRIANLFGDPGSSVISAPIHRGMRLETYGLQQMILEGLYQTRINSAINYQSPSGISKTAEQGASFSYDSLTAREFSMPSRLDDSPHNKFMNESVMLSVPYPTQGQYVYPDEMEIRPPVGQSYNLIGYRQIHTPYFVRSKIGESRELNRIQHHFLMEEVVRQQQMGSGQGQMQVGALDPSQQQMGGREPFQLPEELQHGLSGRWEPAARNQNMDIFNDKFGTLSRPTYHKSNPEIAYWHKRLTSALERNPDNDFVKRDLQSLNYANHAFISGFTSYGDPLESTWDDVDSGNSILFPSGNVVPWHPIHTGMTVSRESLNKMIREGVYHTRRNQDADSMGKGGPRGASFTYNVSNAAPYAGLGNAMSDDYEPYMTPGSSERMMVTVPYPTKGKYYLHGEMELRPPIGQAYELTHYRQAETPQGILHHFLAREIESKLIQSQMEDDSPGQMQMGSEIVPDPKIKELRAMIKRSESKVLRYVGDQSHIYVTDADEEDHDALWKRVGKVGSPAITGMFGIEPEFGIYPLSGPNHESHPILSRYKLPFHRDDMGSFRDDDDSPGQMQMGEGPTRRSFLKGLGAAVVGSQLPISGQEVSAPVNPFMADEFAPNDPFIMARRKMMKSFMSFSEADRAVIHQHHVNWWNEFDYGTPSDELEYVHAYDEMTGTPYGELEDVQNMSVAQIRSKMHKVLPPRYRRVAKNRQLTKYSSSFAGSQAHWTWGEGSPSYYSGPRQLPDYSEFGPILGRSEYQGNDWHESQSQQNMAEMGFNLGDSLPRERRKRGGGRPARSVKSQLTNANVTPEEVKADPFAALNKLMFGDVPALSGNDQRGYDAELGDFGQGMTNAEIDQRIAEARREKIKAEGVRKNADLEALRAMTKAEEIKLREAIDAKQEAELSTRRVADNRTRTPTGPFGRARRGRSADLEAQADALLASTEANEFIMDPDSSIMMSSMSGSLAGGMSTSAPISGGGRRMTMAQQEAAANRIALMKDRQAAILSRLESAVVPVPNSSTEWQWGEGSPSPLQEPVGIASLLRGNRGGSRESVGPLSISHMTQSQFINEFATHLTKRGGFYHGEDPEYVTEQFASTFPTGSHWLGQGGEAFAGRDLLGNVHRITQNVDARAMSEGEEKPFQRFNHPLVVQALHTSIINDPTGWGPGHVHEKLPYLNTNLTGSERLQFMIQAYQANLTYDHAPGNVGRNLQTGQMQITDPGGVEHRYGNYGQWHGSMLGMMKYDRAVVSDYQEHVRQVLTSGDRSSSNALMRISNQRPELFEAEDLGVSYGGIDEGEVLEGEFTVVPPRSRMISGQIIGNQKLLEYTSPQNRRQLRMSRTRLNAYQTGMTGINNLTGSERTLITSDNSSDDRPSTGFVDFDNEFEQRWQSRFADTQTRRGTRLGSRPDSVSLHDELPFTPQLIPSPPIQSQTYRAGIFGVSGSRGGYGGGTSLIPHPTLFGRGSSGGGGGPLALRSGEPEMGIELSHGGVWASPNVGGFGDDYIYANPARNGWSGWGSTSDRGGGYGGMGRPRDYRDFDDDFESKWKGGKGRSTRDVSREEMSTFYRRFLALEAVRGVSNTLYAVRQHTIANEMALGDPLAEAQADIGFRHQMADAVPFGVGHLGLFLRDPTGQDELSVTKPLAQAALMNQVSETMIQHSRISYSLRQQAEIAGMTGTTQQRAISQEQYRQSLVDSGERSAARLEVIKKQYNMYRGDAESEAAGNKGSLWQQHYDFWLGGSKAINDTSMYRGANVAKAGLTAASDAIASQDQASAAMRLKNEEQVRDQQLANQWFVHHETSAISGHEAAGAGHYVISRAQLQLNQKAEINQAAIDHPELIPVIRERHIQDSAALESKITWQENAQKAQQRAIIQSSDYRMQRLDFEARYDEISHGGQARFWEALDKGAPPEQLSRIQEQTEQAIIEHQVSRYQNVGIRTWQLESQTEIMQRRRTHLPLEAAKRAAALPWDTALTNLSQSPIFDPQRNAMVNARNEAVSDAKQEYRDFHYLKQEEQKIRQDVTFEQSQAFGPGARLHTIGAKTREIAGSAELRAEEILIRDRTQLKEADAERHIGINQLKTLQAQYIQGITASEGSLQRTNLGNTSAGNPADILNKINEGINTLNGKLGTLVATD